MECANPVGGEISTLFWVNARLLGPQNQPQRSHYAKTSAVAYIFQKNWCQMVLGQTKKDHFVSKRWICVNVSQRINECPRWEVDHSLFLKLWNRNRGLFGQKRNLNSLFYCENHYFFWSINSMDFFSFKMSFFPLRSNCLRLLWAHSKCQGQRRMRSN